MLASLSMPPLFAAFRQASAAPFHARHDTALIFAMPPICHASIHFPFAFDFAAAALLLPPFSSAVFIAATIFRLPAFTIFVFAAADAPLPFR